MGLVVLYFSSLGFWFWFWFWLFFFFFFFFFPVFLGPLPQHMEIPRLGVDLEL